jgi:ribulose-phosphate 3-epimerase
MLSADFANIQRDVEMMNRGKADYLHIDVMDGVFVPNISYGFPVTRAIKKHSSLPLDFHLMIDHADPYIQDCVDSGAEIISVHYEACKHLHRTLSLIKSLGAKAGIAINPHTSISVLESILPEADLVLIMSVNPGFGGQRFIKETVRKVRDMREMADRLNPGLWIEVDGGINLETGKLMVDAGANMLVAGSYVFSSEDPLKAVEGLKSLA